MTRQVGLAATSSLDGGLGRDAAAEACRMRGVIVGVLLLAGLAAQALLQWWPQLVE